MEVPPTEQRQAPGRRLAKATFLGSIRAIWDPKPYVIAFVLPLAIIAATFFIGWKVDEGGQIPVFILVGIGWLLLARAVRLPRKAGDRAKRLREALGRATFGWGLILVAIMSAIYIGFGWMRKAGFGDELSTAGLTFAIGLSLLYLALMLVMARVAFAQPGSGTTRTFLAVGLIAAWPFAAIGILRATGVDPPAGVVVAVALAGVILFFPLLGALYARRLTRAGTSLRSSGPARKLGRALTKSPMGSPDDGDAEGLRVRLPRNIVVKMGGRPDDAAVTTDTSRPERLEGWAGLFAPVLAFLASGFIFAGAVSVPLERAPEETSPVANRGGSVTPPTGGDDDELLEFYAPALRLAEDEQWVAGDAIDYALSDPQPDLIRPSCTMPAELGTEVPADPKLCLELDGQRLGPDARTLRGPTEELVFEYGKLYPRIYEIPQVAGECEMERPCRLLDYWIFYPNNEWTSPSALGTISQSHRGDWEHVAVGIDGSDHPLFVAYSAHCKGTWRPWSVAPTVAIDDRTDDKGILIGGGKRSHPLVVVARGSHANYATSGRREPDWTSCNDLPDGAGLGLGFLTEQVSAYETTPRVGPIQIAETVPLAEAASILGAPWYWGPDERFHLNGLSVKKAEEHGPDAPARKGDEFDLPLAEIKSRWRCEGEAPEECARLKADM